MQKVDKSKKVSATITVRQGEIIRHALALLMFDINKSEGDIIATAKEIEDTAFDILLAMFTAVELKETN